MKKNPLMMLFLLVFVLSACNTSTQTLVAPTQAPTQAPVEATSDTVDPMQVVEPAAVPPPTEELAQLRANPWQWVSFTDPIETFDIETPERYTVAFNTDASLGIMADCNRAAGSYQGEGGKLTVEIGPVTKAACPPESRSEQFLKLLSGGTLYFFQEGNLHIDLLADAGTMVFAPTSSMPEVNAAPVQALSIPRYVIPAYTTLGTRNADGTPGPNYWQNHSVHDIAIEVAPPGRTVTGTETITYTNNSPNPLPMVVVRLYQNSRLPEAMREENRTADFLTDGIRIDEFSVNGKVIPWATFDAILPFETVKLVPLAQPLMPGESATFTFKWHYDLGLEYNREGVFDPTTFFIGYFFPRISTYSDTDAGLLPGWDLEEYTYRSGRELHNDFADFNYSVTVPKNFLVWATGELQNPDEVLQPDAAQRLLESRTSDEIITIASPDDLQQGLITAQTDTVTWRWKAENISDIAVGVSDHYVWDAGSVVADPAGDRRVSVHAAYAEEFTDFETMAQDIKDIVASVSFEWPGVPYPYSHATVFVGGGDEEFPMMANDGPDAGEGRTERFIAAHELLHNYFPFYMGIDERRYPFMDEGWTTAFEYMFNLEDIGIEAADALFIKMRSGNLVKPYPGEEIPIIMPADATRGMVTGNDGYVKPALAYLALKEYMGDDAFKVSLHAFIDRWHGKRPLPWDMFNTFNDTSDQDLNWFFRNWFFESNYLDIALGDVQTVDGGYAIQVQNVGGAAVPFDVKVVYADDSAESFRQGPGIWQDSPAAITVTITTDKELKSVTLDGGIFVDGNVADNSWSATPAP